VQPQAQRLNGLPYPSHQSQPCKRQIVCTNSAEVELSSPDWLSHTSANALCARPSMSFRSPKDPTSPTSFRLSLSSSNSSAQWTSMDTRMTPRPRPQQNVSFPFSARPHTASVQTPNSVPRPRLDRSSWNGKRPSPRVPPNERRSSLECCPTRVAATKKAVTNAMTEQFKTS
jgi:hypothetical protein